MGASDLRFRRESQQRDLVFAMRAYGARLGTIVQWTGLNRHRVQSLSRFYERDSGADTGRRGIQPSQTAYFGRSPRIETEGLAFALLAFDHGVISSEIRDFTRILPDVPRGWRLIEAYDAYSTMVPGAQIPFERGVQLLSELSRGNIVLRRCRTCPDLMIFDPLGHPQDRCPFCRSEAFV